MHLKFPGRCPSHPFLGSDSTPATRFSVLADPTGALQAAFRRYPRSAPAPHCEMSRYVPLPASANWAKGLSPEQNCPRSLDGTWLMVSMSSPVLGVSSLLRPQSEPQQETAPITMATGSWGGGVEMNGRILRVTINRRLLCGLERVISPIGVQFPYL